MGLNDTRPPKDLAPRLAGLALADVPVPTGREEEWRFTPLARLRGLHALTAETVLNEAGGGVDVPNPVSVTTTEEPFKGFAAADRLTVAALDLSPVGTVITVPRDVVLERPIVIRTVPKEQSVGRAQVVVESGSRATIVVDVIGDGAFAGALQLIARDGADVTLVHIADGEENQVLAGQHHLQIGRDATVRHIVVTLGGDVVRLIGSAEFDGPGGSIDALGVFFTDAGQHHEHRLSIDHNASHCRSNVAYKGALQGDDAHAVWIGDVLIRANATATQTYEINRNLLLTEGARADSVPNLEIETGDVLGAGHASTTGRLDEEQMFYLMSRGVPAAEARRLVVRGFIAEIVQGIPVPEIRDRLLRRVEERLGAHDPRYDFGDQL